MPTTCCVRGCRSRGSGGNNKIKYFRFPKDESRRKLWVQAIRRENFVPTNNSMVCHNHFTEDDYQKRPDLIKLTNIAVPSVSICMENVKRNIQKKKLVMESNLKSSQKSGRKLYDVLTDHSYVLKFSETLSVEEISIDPSTCMIQTLKVGENFINEPCVIDLSKSKEPTLDDVNNSCLETPENVKSPVNYSEMSWKEIALAQQKTIKDIRKKVKVLQQKIRRQTAKIEKLKIMLMLHLILTAFI